MTARDKARAHGRLCVRMTLLGFKGAAWHHERKMRQYQAQANIRMKTPAQIRADDMREFLAGDYEMVS